MSINEDKLKDIFSTILEIPVEKINDETNSDNVDGWDSLKHMNLILAIEEEFEVEIPDEEVGDLTSYPLVKMTLKELS